MTPEYRNPLFVTRTWHIKRTQAAEIARIGNELNISHNALVRKMLAHSLKAIKNGDLVLDVEPLRFKLISEE